MAYEGRTGSVWFTGQPDTIYQEAHPGVETYSQWFTPEAMWFSHFVHDTPHDVDNGRYAYLLGVGSTVQGYDEYSARLVLPIDPVNASSIIDGPDFFDPFTDDLPMARELIPLDAWVTHVRFTLYWYAQPQNWRYVIHQLRHTNTLMAQPDNLDGYELTPQVDYYQSSVATTIINSDQSQNAYDTINQAPWEYRLTIRHSYNNDLPEAPPVLHLPKLDVQVFWEGIETISVDDFDGAPFAFGMQMAADIERRRNLDGLLEASMAVAGDVKLIGNLVGDFIAPMYNIADPTKDIDGIDTGIDNTGWFNADMALDASLTANFKIEGESAMSLSLAAAIEPVRSLVGSLLCGLDLSDAGLQKDGSIWVNEDGFEMRMNFNTPELLGNRNLMGAFNASMVVAADLESTRQLAGVFDASMDAAATISSIRPLAGVFPAIMVGTGTLIRLVDMVGAFSGDLSLYGEIFRFYGEPAPDEQTVWMTQKCKTVKMGYRENEIIMDTRKRT